MYECHWCYWTGLDVKQWLFHNKKHAWMIRSIMKQFLKYLIPFLTKEKKTVPAPLKCTITDLMIIGNNFPPAEC